MSSLGKSIVLLVAILVIGGGLVFWKQKYGGHSSSTAVSFNTMTKEEMELLFKDASPMARKTLAEDPEKRKQQIESLKELLAMASAAEKDPQINDANTKKILEIIDASIWAQNYDREINKDKGQMPPFGFITEDQVKEYYGEGDNVTAEQKQHQADFDDVLKVQLEYARKNKAIPEGQEPTDEDKKQLKDQYAKIKIYEAEAKAKQGELGPDFVKKVQLQSKLQQAQFLSRPYSTDILAKKAEVTDDDVQKYLADHPDLNTEETKKAKANEVLQKLKNGGDFAALAKEYSDDPGSKDKGGLYENVSEGSGFDKDFESAALALQPGQFTQEIVPTQFGYHIIKLEKKGETKDKDGQVKKTYDVRHILFSTMVKDPENPMGREMPVKDFVKAKLEKEKQDKVLEDLIAENHVEIAEDFVIPPVTDEELKKQQMQQQMPPQMQMPDESPDGPKNAPVKPDAKKPVPNPPKKK